MAELSIAQGENIGSAAAQPLPAPIPPAHPQYPHSLHGAALVMAAALSLGLTGCGGGGDDASSSTTPPTNNATPAPTPAPTPTP